VQLRAEFRVLGFGYLSVQKISCGNVRWTERCERVGLNVASVSWTERCERELD